MVKDSMIQVALAPINSYHQQNNPACLGRCKHIYVSSTNRESYEQSCHHALDNEFPFYSRVPLQDTRIRCHLGMGSCGDPMLRKDVIEWLAGGRGGAKALVGGQALWGSAAADLAGGFGRGGDKDAGLRTLTLCRTHVYLYCGVCRCRECFEQCSLAISL
jgi:hypothetical protein